MTPQGPHSENRCGRRAPRRRLRPPVKPLPGKPDAPRIALIVSGLGVSANATSAAISQAARRGDTGLHALRLRCRRLAARARDEGHEILLQAPMEPFGYPDNDSGPQTLLTSLTPQQNFERLYWLMSRFQGYVGIAGTMGARFTASEQAFARCCAKPRARADFCRRRLQSQKRRRPDSRRQQLPIVRADMISIQYPRLPKSTTRWPPGNGRARARRRRRHSFGAAGIDRAHRQMGEGGGKPRHPAGADQRGGAEAETELASAQMRAPSVRGLKHGRRHSRLIGRIGGIGAVSGSDVGAAIESMRSPSCDPLRMNRL